MSAARQELHAVAASSVWQSSGPVPMPYLVLTVNSCASGRVYLWWQNAISARNAQTTPPDRVLGPGATVTIDTGLVGGRTLYIADSQLGAFDVAVAADRVPIDTSAAPPTIAPPPVGVAFRAAGDGATWTPSNPLAIPAGTVAVRLAFPNNEAAPLNVQIVGTESGTPYYNGPPANTGVSDGGTVTAQVSAVLDQHITVILNTGSTSTFLSGTMEPLQSSPVPQPLAVVATSQERAAAVAVLISATIPAGGGTLNLDTRTMKVRHYSLTVWGRGYAYLSRISLLDFGGTTLHDAVLSAAAGLTSAPIEADLHRMPANSGLQLVAAGNASAAQPYDVHGVVIADFDP